jgi:hypothetical protein
LNIAHPQEEEGVKTRGKVELRYKKRRPESRLYKRSHRVIPLSGSPLIVSRKKLLNVYIASPTACTYSILVIVNKKDRCRGNKLN